MSKKSNSSGEIGCLTGIFMVFIILKLTGIEPVASWSWWWVTAPIWGGIVILLLMIVILMLITFITVLFD